MGFDAALAGLDLAVLDLLGGKVVRYAPRVGEPVDVRGMFTKPYLRGELGEAGIVSSEPAVDFDPVEAGKLRARGIDPTNDDPVITIDGAQYRVREPQQDERGGVRLLLRKA